MSWLRLVLAVLSGVGVYIAVATIGPDHLTTERFVVILTVGVVAPDVVVLALRRLRDRRARVHGRQAGRP